MVWTESDLGHTFLPVTSILYQSLEEEVSKAKVAMKYGTDTLMDLSDGGDLNLIQEKLFDAAPSVTFGSVPIYQAYGHGVAKCKNSLNITEDDFLNAFEKHAKTVLTTQQSIPG